MFFSLKYSCRSLTSSCALIEGFAAARTLASGNLNLVQQRYLLTAKFEDCRSRFVPVKITCNYYCSLVKDWGLTDFDLRL